MAVDVVRVLPMGVIVSVVMMVALMVIVAIVLLYGLLNFLPVLLLCITWGYILLGIILSTIRLIAGKKSKTLEDFEPEEEDFE